MVINDHVSKAVTLVNAGSLMYEYHWKLSADPRLAVEPPAGSVGPGARAVCKLSFSPTTAQQLNQHKVTCQVVNGRTYSLVLSGLFPPSCVYTDFLQQWLVHSPDGSCARAHVFRRTDSNADACFA